MNLRAFAAPLVVALAALALGSVGGAGCDSGPEMQPLRGQVSLTLLHTADMHSRLFPYNLQLGLIDSGLGLGEVTAIANVGGAARISHIIGRERARSSRALHLDGGDCFQGAPVFNFYSGEAEIRALSAMGVDAMIVANHEFDRGGLNLAIQLQNYATFPVLAANYLLEDPEQPGASPLGTVIQPFQVFMLDGLRVGVVGMGNLSSVTSLFESPNRLGITPLNTTEVAQFYTDLLRPIVDVVAFVTHLGLEHDQDMIESTTGIDIVLGGHNHIVLQPPKRVRDCSRFFDEAAQSFFIEIPNPVAGDPDKKTRRFCRPRDVVLAHSGAFAKYVGRLDLILSNDPVDFEPGAYDPGNGFEVLSHHFELFPVNENVPDDPIVGTVLEPYQQGLDALANLDLLVGYGLDGSRRFDTAGGDSPLGNMIATAMWLRLGIQTDFSLTNTTGIRADLVPGPVTVEQMYNIFPFDNSVSKMQLSGTEVKDLFDFVARRSTGRGCVSQVQIAGARVVLDCTQQASPDLPPGVATQIYIGTQNLPCSADADCPGMAAGACDQNAGQCRCTSDTGCPGALFGSCDIGTGRCWQPIDPIASYELATSNYLAQGGSGFRVLQRNTTQFDTQVQQRDALIDYIRAGSPCGLVDAEKNGNLKAQGADPAFDECHQDQDCDAVTASFASPGDFVCACPEAVLEGPLCETDSTRTCAAGLCVLRKCREDVAAYQRRICSHAPSDALKASCEAALLPCSSAGEQCKFLACVDRNLGNFSDGRLRMVGQ